MQRETLTTIGVVALLLLAGCSAIVDSEETATTEPTDAAAGPLTQAPTDATTPTATTPATPTVTDTQTHGETATATLTLTATPAERPPDVELEGGDLSVDEDRIYANVQTLLGAEAEPPTVVVTDEMPTLESYNRILASDPFHRTFGFGDEYVNTSVYHGTASPDRIVVMTRNAKEAQVETLLAHEYVHWLQFHTDVVDTSGYGEEFVDDTDSQQVRLGLVEGASVYITDRYVDRYVNVSWNQTTELREQYEAGPAGRRLFRARYLFGARYIHGTIDDPVNLSWIYDEDSPTPVTSEQLIHGDTPSGEPERSLDVSVSTSGNWSTRPASRDTKGEMYVRTMLRAELDRETAADAAAGWGTDRTVRVTNETADDGAGFAWALRWDNATHADEFETAFAEWTAERSGDDTGFRQVRVTDETVVVFAGNDSFVDAASAAGDRGNVTIDVGS